LIIGVFVYMETIKSLLTESTINIDYDDFTNTVELSIANKTGCKIANLNVEKCEEIKEQIEYFKNQII